MARRILLPLLGIGLAACAQEMSFTNRVVTFTNLQGRVFADVEVRRADRGGLIWRSGVNGGRVAYTNLPDSFLESLGIPASLVQESRALAQPGAARALAPQVVIEKTWREEEWPQWRGPHQNGAGHSRQALAVSWPNGRLPRVWLNDRLPGGGNSSPVIANDRVYLYIHQKRERKDTVFCLDENTGRERWRRDFPVAQETLHETSGSPCVVGALCLVTGARCCYGLDAVTGALLWKSDWGAQAQDPAQESCSSFAYAAGVVAGLFHGPVLGLDVRSGAILWRAKTPGGWAENNSSAVAWKDQYFIYQGRDRVLCLEAKTGEVAWELPGGGNGFTTYGLSPVVSGDVLVAFSQGQLRGFSLSSGKPQELWHIAYGEEYSTPAADAEHLYLVSPGFIYKDGADRGTYDKRHYALTCCELKTGKTVWESPIGQCEYSSPIVVDGKVFTLTDKARQLAMFAARDGKRLGVAGVDTLGWTSPSAAHGRLFLRLRRGVACYDLGLPSDAKP